MNSLFLTKGSARLTILLPVIFGTAILLGGLILLFLSGLVQEHTPRRSPNAGNGLGRVIREIHKDGSFGPVYFIRYNRHAGWDESNTDFPWRHRQDSSVMISPVRNRNHH